MRLIYPVFSTLVVIFISIELSSQSNRNSPPERVPGSPSTGQQLHDQTSLEESPFRERSRSPPCKPPSSKVLGYSLTELGFIRLIPHTNRGIEFEFRRCIIPDGQPIRVRSGRSFVPMPKREHIVLSASNGDIFAILENSGVLRGIYRTNRNHSRVRINMISGKIENMTSDEIRDCPIGEIHPIFPHSFIKVVANSNSLQSDSNTIIESNLGSHSSERQPSSDQSSPEESPFPDGSISPPGRPPTHEVLGYKLEELGYIRLIPKKNRHQRFQFRRYVFPVEKRLQLLLGSNRFVPVPTREHIVLSTSSGDVFAILEYTGILRGIYMTHRNHYRIKLNMVSGAVHRMTADEVQECRIGIGNPVHPNFLTEVGLNHNSMETLYH